MKLPEYKEEYPSKFEKGTLGWVLDQEFGVEEIMKERKRIIQSEIINECHCPWCKSPGNSVGTTTEYACGSSIGCAHQRQSEACKIIEKLRFALKTIADINGCDCDNDEDHGERCGLCRVRTTANIALWPIQPDMCEHGIIEGNWCEDCNKDYKQAIKENGEE